MNSRVKVWQSDCTISVVEASGFYIWQSKRKAILEKTQDIVLKEFPNAQIQSEGILDSNWYNQRTPSQIFNDEPLLHIVITLGPSDALKAKLKGDLLDQLQAELAPL